MPMRRNVIASLAVLLTVQLLGATPAPAADEKVKVVASFSILGDITARIGGDRIALTTLVGPDGDAHVYQPTPTDAAAVRDARLLIVNGLGFEGWMERLVGASGGKPTLVVAAKGVKALKSADHEHGHGHGKGHDHGEVDPHAWQDPRNVALYARNIGKALAAADPAGAEGYMGRAEAYAREVEALHQELSGRFAAIPNARRKVITTHDAFRYLGRAYAIDFIAPTGVSTESEASAKDVARIIRQIKAEKITAVFLENISDRRLLDQIVRETGAKVGGTLFSDALSKPEGPAGSYLALMRHNTDALLVAFTGS